MATETITRAPSLRRREATNTALPLTTIFTPPSSCLNAPFSLVTSQSGEAGFSTAIRDYDETSSECYPQSFSSLQYNWNFYSPGICPSGWQIGQTRTTNVHTTQAWCCPSSMIVTLGVSGGTNYQYCTTLASNGPILSYDSTSWTTITPTGFTYFAFQWPLSIEWASTDLDLFTPASAPLRQLAAATGVVSLPSTALLGTGTASARATYTRVRDGMSTGVKAGIAVAVVVVAIAIGTAVMFLVLRTRRRRIRTQYETPKDQSSEYGLGGKVELPGEGVEIPRWTPSVELSDIGASLQELDAQTRVELGDVNSKKEMSPVELDADWRGHEADT